MGKQKMPAPPKFPPKIAEEIRAKIRALAALSPQRDATAAANPLSPDEKAQFIAQRKAEADALAQALGFRIEIRTDDGSIDVINDDE